jgi:hypothetical protein
MYFGESILAKRVFGHFFCPFSIFPKNFPSKKQGLLLQSVAMQIPQFFTYSLHYVAFSP